MADNSTIRMRPDAAHLLAQATEALAALGLTIWQVGALATASDVADAAQDPEQWDSGATLEEIAEEWSEGAWELRRDEIRDAGEYLLAAGEDEGN